MKEIYRRIGISNLFKDLKYHLCCITWGLLKSCNVANT